MKRMVNILPETDIQSIVTKERLERASDEGVKMFGTCRARLISSGCVPFLCDLTSTCKLEVILIDGFKGNSENSSVSVGKDSNGDENCSEDIQFGGSPLKFEFLTLSKLQEKDTANGKSADVLQSNALFDSNPLCEASYTALWNELIAFNRKTVFDDSLRCLPVSILTDGADVLNTKMIGFWRSGNESVNLYRVRSFQGKMNNPLDVKDLRDSLRFLSLYDENSQASAVFNVIPKEEARSEQQSIGFVSAFMALKMSWNTRANDFSMRIPRTVDAISLRLSPGWLDKRMPFYELATQLRFIISLAHASCFGHMNRLKQNKAVAKTDKSIVDSVKKLIEEERMRDIHSSASDQSLDFAEKLWLMLKSCESNDMLARAFETIFNFLQLGTLRVILHSDNRTQLARLIRDSQAGLKPILPRLDGLMSLQLLLEIGLEYFRRRCTEQFIQNDCVERHTDLNHYFETRPAESIEDRTDFIFLYFNSLLVSLTCKSHLNLNKFQCYELSKDIVSHYCTLRHIKPSREGVSDELFSRLIIDLSPKLHPSNIEAWTSSTRAPTSKFLESSYWSGETMIYQTMVHFSKSMEFGFADDQAKTFCSKWNDNTMQSVKNDSSTSEDITTNCDDAKAEKSLFENYFCHVLITRLNAPTSL